MENRFIIIIKNLFTDQILTTFTPSTNHISELTISHLENRMKFNNIITNNKIKFIFNDKIISKSITLDTLFTNYNNYPYRNEKITLFIIKQ
jgi:hypothetical protein